MAETKSMFGEDFSYVDYHHQKEDETGFDDPEVIGEMQKSKWQIYHEQKIQEQAQQKLKNNEDLALSDLSWGQALTDGLTNLPKSYLNVFVEEIQGLWNIVRHPVITSQSMYKLAQGIGQFAAAETINANKDMPMPEFDPKQDAGLMAVNEAVNYLKTTYGTEEGFKEAIAENPARVLHDVITTLVPIAKVGQVGKLSKISKLQKTLGVVEKTALSLEAIKLPRATARFLGHGIMNLPKFKKLPESLYKRSIKLSKDLPLEKQEHLVKLALKNDLSLSVKNLQRLNDQIDDLDNIVDTMITQLDQPIVPGQPWTIPKIHLNDLVSGLDKFANKTLKTHPTRGIAGQKAINRVKKTVEKWSEKINQDEFLPSEVQTFKKEIYKSLKDDYKNAMKTVRKTQAFSTEAEMKIARNIKESLEAISPDFAILEHTKLNNKLIQRHFPGAPALDLKQINRLEGDLLEIRHAMVKSVQEIEKGSFFDFQVTAKTATGAAAGHFISNLIGSGDEVLAPIGFGIGITLGILDSNPHIKSKAAVFLNDLRRMGISPRTNVAMIRLGIYQANNLSNIPENVRVLEQQQLENNEPVTRGRFSITP
jgi:hypothetical protein